MDLHTVSAPSGKERTLNATAQVERAALCLRRFSGAQPGVRWVRRTLCEILVFSYYSEPRDYENNNDNSRFNLSTRGQE